MSDVQMYPPEEPVSIQEAFEAFHAKHPKVYEALRHLAHDALRNGHKKIGIGMLWEVVRWNLVYAMRKDDAEEWKLNNNLRSRYARKLMADDPALADIFETRELKAP